MKNKLIILMLKTKEEIEEWLLRQEYSKEKEIIINDDLTVDIVGDIRILTLGNKDANIFPVQFGIIKGDFIINYKNLISLKGSPREVHGIFHIAGNKLTSLKYSPKIVTKNFVASYNQLTSLEGCTEEVGSFFCQFNQLQNLKYGPTKVRNTYDVNNNKLISLEGSPKKINSEFNVSDNKLESLQFGPEIVKGKLKLFNNNIRSLKGFPLKVKSAELEGNLFDIKECRDLDIKTTIVCSYITQEDMPLLKNLCIKNNNRYYISLEYAELRKILMKNKLEEELTSQPMMNRRKL